MVPGVKHTPESNIVYIIPEGGRCFPERLVEGVQDCLEEDRKTGRVTLGHLKAGGYKGLDSGTTNGGEDSGWVWGGLGCRVVSGSKDTWTPA